MGSPDKKIRMTIVLAMADYMPFHQKVESSFTDKTKVVRKLIRAWVLGSCQCGKRHSH
jgi:hypothetical protein